ncbi:glycoside hydrolase family 25 protein [Novosphingobium lentum]|uniref:glycoside hydrolase family 25 protein n=1 Tax=Novosphingobium lentum TaxID=145287 RepID=UPI000837A13F|nr:glycoside hydrolase family 25 protein [Novosphingobium lentum]
MAKANKATRQRWLAAGLLAAIMALGIGWWEARTWTPSRDRYPLQGVWIDSGDGVVDWRLLKARGADFAYLTASRGAGTRDAAFADGLASARERGMQAGAVHVYDPCTAADGQAANFVTTVPRDAKLLPPAIRLDLDADACPAPPSEAALQGELTTFLNQIEMHTGKPAILMLSRSFEARYHLAAMIDRNVWVEGDFLAPGYAGRPWVMWTASHRLRNDAASSPLRWVVVQP